MPRFLRTKEDGKAAGGEINSKQKPESVMNCIPVFCFSTCNAAIKTKVKAEQYFWRDHCGNKRETEKIDEILTRAQSRVRRGMSTVHATAKLEQELRRRRKGIFGAL